MEQALDAVIELEEGAVLLGLGDLALDQRPGREPLLDGLPGVLAHLPQRERDPRQLVVQLDDLDLDLVADREDLVDRVDPIPGELADVDQPVGAAEVDEGSIGGQAADPALDHVADLKLLEQLLALASAVLLHVRLLPDDEAIALAIDL